jgi:uncharacterized small protein (DUF1192 family)
MTELTGPQIRDGLAPLFAPGVADIELLSAIATRVQQWQVEQRAAYRQEISRLERDLSKERAGRIAAELKISEVVETLKAQLEGYWATT